MVNAVSQEQRRFERLSAAEDFRQTSWAYHTDSLLGALFRKRYAASILEISEGGIGLLTNKNLKRNQYIEVLVQYRNFSSFTIVARVMSSREFDREQINGEEVIFFRVGLMIEQCSAEDRNRMKKVIHRLKIKQAQEPE